METINVLFIFDSRGRGMQTRIGSLIHESAMPINVHTITLPGSTIATATQYVERTFTERTFDFVYLMVGVNNLTLRLSSKYVIPIYLGWSTCRPHRG